MEDNRIRLDFIVGEYNNSIHFCIYKDKAINKIVLFSDTDCEEIPLSVKQAKELANAILTCAKQ